jgi:nucleoside-diphosphate-sugar epimerase
VAGKRYIVTGGGGFVGKAIGRALVSQGCSVLALARGTYPDLKQYGIESAQVDLGDDVTQWQHLFEGCQGVFHTAAKVDMWGRRESFVRSNITATRNIVAACRSAGVPAIVYTSSPSVVHTGKDLVGVDESQPVPAHFEAYYPETKALAEQEILAESDAELRTVALRPHLIWGPGDTNLIPTVLERARTGKLVKIGQGKNLVDLTFIDDCVQAHLLAMQMLESDPSRVAGKAYFISQGDPVPLWSWIDEVLVAHGLPPVKRSISFPTAMKIAGILEALSKLLLWVGIDKQPRLTRFLVSEMATSHYFNISRANNDFGYQPSCTIKEALDRTFSRSV